MPNTNTDLQLKASFYHSLGKVITESNNLVGNELYKSSHNVRSNEIWMDSIDYSPTFASASQTSDNGTSVLKLGTASNPLFIYPLKGTNYQSWFIDTGTPTSQTDGFIPSSGWAKPLINPSDVSNEIGAPSFGFELKMYRRDGITPISYGSAFYDVDYFAGLIRFQLSGTPKDASNGLGFVFSSTSFEASGDKYAYINNSTTGGPRVTAFKYVGRTLADIDLDNIGGVYSTGVGITISNSEISVNIDDETIKVNNDNNLYVGSDIIYQTTYPLSTIGDNQPTGITISSDVIGYSNIQVYVNGQIQTIGDGNVNANCYLFDGINPVGLNSILAGNELYWNGSIGGFDLDLSDLVVIVYNTKETI